MVTADPGSGGPTSPAGPASPPLIAYQADAPNAYEWTEVAYNYLVEGKLTASIRALGGISTATVTGTCPYCKDDVRFSEVLDAVSGESLSTLSGLGRFARLRGAPPVQADDVYVALTVFCSCTGQHSGRPDGVSYGCGVSFQVEVRREA
jgi:hypothetical protein